MTWTVKLRLRWKKAYKIQFHTWTENISSNNRTPWSKKQSGRKLKSGNNYQPNQHPSLTQPPPHWTSTWSCLAVRRLVSCYTIFSFINFGIVVCICYVKSGVMSFYAALITVGIFGFSDLCLTWRFIKHQVVWNGEKEAWID